MSNKIMQAYAVCNLRFRYKIWDKRFAYSALAFFMLVYLVEEGIRDFVIYSGNELVPCVFPFLTSDWIFQTFITGYFVWLISTLCDDKSDLFVKARAGNMLWKIGNCFAIIKTVAVYLVYLIIVSSVIFFPYIQFENKWGPIWKTLSLTNAKEQYGVEIIISPIIMHLNTPLMAFLKSVVLQFLCLCWIGMMIYVINLLIRKSVGNYFAIAIILLDTMLSNTSNEQLFRFSPITLVQLSNYSVGYAKYGISYSNSVLFYCLGIIGCFVSCCISNVGKEK